MLNGDALIAETNWAKLYDKVEILLNKLDFKSSRRICVFSCMFSSFIHQATIPQLFIQDHDSFWENFVYKNGDVLFSFKRSDFLELKPRDFYDWLALYYINICIGVYFGNDVLVKSPGFVYNAEEMDEISKLLFYMSLDCLFKAEHFKIPDIRSVQVYCCMSLCMHALGRLYLDDAILNIVINNSRILGLSKDKSENDDSELLFSKEVGRRLWQTLVINEWMEHADTPDRLNIRDSNSPTPKLITISQLLGQEPITESDIKFK